LSQTLWSNFNHCDVISPQSYRIRRNNAKLRPLRRSRIKIIQGRRFRYQYWQWTARMRLPMWE